MAGFSGPIYSQVIVDDPQVVGWEGVSKYKKVVISEVAIGDVAEEVDVSGLGGLSRVSQPEWWRTLSSHITLTPDNSLCTVNEEGGY